MARHENYLKQPVWVLDSYLKQTRLKPFVFNLKYMKKILMFVVLITVLFIPSLSQAHPGRTDSSGCHTCRTNCSKWGLSTGEYHCHQAKALPQPVEPIKSHYSENGGYTTPAPEYKQPKIQVVEPKNTPAVDTVKTDLVINDAMKNNPPKPSKSLFARFWEWLFK